jgi:hypothetical protein
MMCTAQKIKSYGAALVALLLFAACNNSEADKNTSQGNLNEISIIVTDVMWNGQVGDSLRKKLAAPVEGLSIEEPLFTLNQYREETFSGDIKNGRNIIFIEKGTKNHFEFKQNSYCRPQNVFTITGTNTNEMLTLISMHGDEIIKAIKKTEIAENQQRNKKAGLRDTMAYAGRYGIKIKVPLTYKYAVNNPEFAWLKKDIPGGNTNLLLYSVPYATIEHDKDNMVGNIINMRDSIGSKYIHGKEPGTYMVTEEAYSPSMFMTSFYDKRAFETRGNWEMSQDFMKGIFVNYAIRNDKKQCYFVIEGFIYSPSSPKRDLLMELESIIRSVTFIK